MALIRAFMTYGHLQAELDPLDLDTVYADIDLGGSYGSPGQKLKQLIDYKFYGFTERDLDRTFYVDLPQLGGILAKKKDWTLRELIDTLSTAYCNKIGVEFMHIPHRDQCVWIRNKFELYQYDKWSAEKKIHILDRLLWCDEFAQFLAFKFNTMKRFGLEGCESFIPGMKSCMDTLVQHGVEKCIIGMPHRGRLNMLANVVRKPHE